MDNDQNNIDHILGSWKFDPHSVAVRLLTLGNREIIQLRIDLGLLQLEVNDRPDGWRPGGEPTYLHYIRRQAVDGGEAFVLNETQCAEIDREFVQFYHRRVCLLQLKRFEAAVRDADHTLALMNFCKVHSPSEEWTISHEQYRPFVLYHRIKAAALHCFETSAGAERAIEEINLGLEQLREFFSEFEVVENFEENELVQRLMEFRETIRAEYSVGRTLRERLSDAIAAEQYELAAQIRDQLTRRHTD
jgi:hypothetical protein